MADFLEMANIGVESQLDEIHLVIWAKRGHLPHWPAKLLRFVNDNKIEVEMFGDHSPGHSRFILANWNCFLYTKQHPTGSNTKKYKEKLSEAMKESEQYIQNVISKCSVFNYAEQLIVVSRDTFNLFFSYTFGQKHSNDVNETIPSESEENVTIVVESNESANETDNESPHESEKEKRMTLNSSRKSVSKPHQKQTIYESMDDDDEMNQMTMDSSRNSTSKPFQPTTNYDTTDDDDDEQTNQMSFNYSRKKASKPPKKYESIDESSDDDEGENEITLNNSRQKASKAFLPPMNMVNYEQAYVQHKYANFGYFPQMNPFVYPAPVIPHYNAFFIPSNAPAMLYSHGSTAAYNVPTYIQNVTPKRKHEPYQQSKHVKKIKQYERGYQCDLCSKSYSQKRNLIQHQKTHDSQTSQKDYKCDICSKSFSNQGNLNKHIQTHVKKEAQNDLGV